MTLKAPKGVFDVVPRWSVDSRSNLWRASSLWQWLEGEIRAITRVFGYHELRTPLFERTELFERGVGEASDIVSKEMYSFEDKGKRSLTLRPEGTAPVMRSVIEEQLYQHGSIQKLYYIGPMFRYERPQAGRYRQHHQFGVEAIGDGSPEQDVEVIDLLISLYRNLGIQELGVLMNFLGSPESRQEYLKALEEYFSPYASELSEDSQRRLKKNPLRILDSKDEGDKKLVAAAPVVLDFLSPGERAHFERVQALLEMLGITARIEPQLVRGLDYYNGLVFEVVTSSLGAQNSIGGGGRYDGLIRLLGGPDLPSIGFGSGMERILQTVLDQRPEMDVREGPLLFLIPLGDRARAEAFRQTHALRHEGFCVEMDSTGRKLKKIMSHANTIGARFVAVLGDNELDKRQVDLKEMETGEQVAISLDALSEALRARRSAESAIKN